MTVLGKFLSEDVGLADLHAGWVYSLFTGGITAAMLILGGVADRIGVRRALLISLLLMVVGRLSLAGAGTFFEHGQGAASAMFFFVLLGLAIVVVGYGMYQPAAYAGVKKFTNKKTAAIGYAMIYALMNLGAFVSGLISPSIRHSAGIEGVFWVYVVITLLAALSVLFVLTRKTAAAAEARVRQEDAKDTPDTAAPQDDSSPSESDESTPAATATPSARLWEPATVVFAAIMLATAGGLIYLAITAQPPTVQRTLSAYSTTASQATGKLANAAGQSDVAAVRDSAVALAAELEAVADHLTVPEAPGMQVDPSAFVVARSVMRAGAIEAAQLADLEQPFAPAPLDAKVSADVQMVLRTHAVRLMAAAFSLVSPVDQEVVHNLRLRLKRVEEEIIPVSQQDEQAILALANTPTGQLLASLHEATKGILRYLPERLPRDAAIVAELNVSAQNSFFEQLTATLPQELGPAGRKVLTEYLLAQSMATIAAADQLQQSIPSTAVAERRSAMDSVLAALGFGGAGPAAVPLIIDYVNQWLAEVANTASELGAIMPEAAQPPLAKRTAAFFWRYGMLGFLCLLALIGLVWRVMALRPEHPFHNSRFTFFIFVLIPVQTLFAHNWLTLPYYINRAFGGTAVGDNFEFFSNINPIMIFVLTPLVAAMTLRANVYRMMIWGTIVMAVPTFLLVLPPNPVLLMTYIVLMSVGEAMWQPRFLQLVAEIAPEGKTGAYMGIAQLPWFMTKVVTGLYSGAMLAQFCPSVGPQNSQALWLIHGLIAMISPVALIAAKGWIGNRIEEKQV